MGLSGADAVLVLCNYVPDFCLARIGRSPQVEMVMCLSSACLLFLPACIELRSQGWGCAQCTQVHSGVSTWNLGQLAQGSRG